MCSSTISYFCASISYSLSGISNKFVNMFAFSFGIATEGGSLNASDAWFIATVTTIFTSLVQSAVAATNLTRKYLATADTMYFNPKL